MESEWRKDVLKELRKIGESVEEIRKELMREAARREQGRKSTEKIDKRGNSKGTEEDDSKEGKIERKDKNEDKGFTLRGEYSEKCVEEVKEEEGEESLQKKRKNESQAKEKEKERTENGTEKRRRECVEEGDEVRLGRSLEKQTLGEEEENEKEAEGKNREDWRESWETKIEMEKKERRKRSLVWKGVGGKDAEERSRRVNIMSQIELGKKVMIKKQTELTGEGGRKLILMELEEEEDRNVLLGKKNDIWEKWRAVIEEDLSSEERKQKWRIKEKAREERFKGKRVEYNNRRIWIEGTEWRWAEKEGKWKSV
ncbi:vicilin-like seed storage protein At2g18540 [Osmia bicornis bicornis]|uniref:vicilin-like seed storage protein At2g18540 n=1 Tax=Osmia bicornis bicornis TaxID=1437191 RepID=UPI001EAF503E|nr:vicilin-like seed storage protein At2g18540 [Osmia bicornis bicornis]